MMLHSRKALLLHVSSALLIPTKYIRQRSRVIAEPLLVNTEKSGSRDGWWGGNWTRGNAAQIWESGFQKLQIAVSDDLRPDRVRLLIKGHRCY